MDLVAYRQLETEKARTADLLRIVPKNRRTVLDVGARDGYLSRLLAGHFAAVTALDLTRPQFDHPGVNTVAGDLTQLAYPDASFDVVFCAEVLEHIPEIERACRELARVARHEVVIGVPFDQDIRISRTTCAACGKISPPFGHVNSFTRQRLFDLFPTCSVVCESYVGSKREATNAIAAWLMDLGGNPWGVYDQAEGCVHCGSVLTAPGKRPVWQKACSAIAARMNSFQTRWTPSSANWIHIVFEKVSSYSSR